MRTIYGIERRKNENEPWRMSHSFYQYRSSAEKELANLKIGIAHKYMSLASALGPNKRKGTEGYRQKMTLNREMEFEMENIKIIERRLDY